MQSRLTLGELSTATGLTIHQLGELLVRRSVRLHGYNRFYDRYFPVSTGEIEQALRQRSDSLFVIFEINEGHVQQHGLPPAHLYLPINLGESGQKLIVEKNQALNELKSLFVNESDVDDLLKNTTNITPIAANKSLRDRFARSSDFKLLSFDGRKLCHFSPKQAEAIECLWVQSETANPEVSSKLLFDTLYPDDIGEEKEANRKTRWQLDKDVFKGHKLLNKFILKRDRTSSGQREATWRLDFHWNPSASDFE